MVITNHSSDLPHTALVLPDVNELRDALAMVRPYLTKTMITDLNSAEALDGIHFQRSSDQLSTDFATDVLLDVLNEPLP